MLPRTVELVSRDVSTIRCRCYMRTSAFEVACMFTFYVNVPMNDTIAIIFIFIVILFSQSFYSVNRISRMHITSIMNRRGFTQDVPKYFVILLIIYFWNLEQIQ